MPVIPKGDNFGNAQIRAGRTNLQGDNGAVGRAMAGLGRDVMGVGLKLQQEKEQKRKSLNRVSMANGAMEYQQQVNEALKNVNEQVNSGQLPPEKARQKTQELISNIDTQAFRPNDLDEEESAVWGLNINKINNGADLEATGVEEKGVKLKAQTDINKLITNAKANNYNPEQVQQMLNSEDVKKTGTLVWGLASQENLKSLGRSYTTDYLQNEITTAADKGDYKALKRIKSDIQNQEYHKDWVLSDDRVRLIHGTNSAMKRLESEWKAAQAQLKSDISYSDQNVLAASANGDLLDNPYSKKDYINAYGQKDGLRRYKNVTEWQTEVAPKILSYKDMSVADIVKDVDSSKPIDKDHDMYASQDRVHKFKLAAAQQAINEKRTNPFNAAVKSGLFKPFDSANPDDMTNEIARRYAAQPELRKIDINAPLLSKGEADMLSQSIRGAKNTDAQIALLKGLGEKLPPEAVKGVAAQIAPDSAAVAFSSMLLNTPDTSNGAIGYKQMSINDAVSTAFDPKERNKPRSANDLITTTIDKNEAVKTILQGDQLLNPTEAMKKSGVSKVSLPSDNKLKETFNSYVGNAFQHNPQAYQLTFDVYKSAYAGLAYRSGDIDDIKTDTVSEDIAKKAALMATGGVTKNASNVWGVATSKKAVVMPYGMDESAFRDKYKAATVQSLKEAGLNYNGWNDLTPVNVGNNTYRLAYGNTGQWAINPKTGNFVTVEIE